jgi:hypothetical protein
MKAITLADIRNIAEYEKIRPEFRRRMIELKKRRRVPVGDLVTFVFENRETALFQIQEMMRAERIVDEAKIQQEIDVYNELVPGPNELSATMFIEIDDHDRLRQMLPTLVGIERSVLLRIGQHEIAGLFEPGRSTDEKTSTVHYLAFPFTAEQIEAFQDHATEAHLTVNHPNYQASATLESDVRAALCEDLQAAAD